MLGVEDVGIVCNFFVVIVDVVVGKINQKSARSMTWGWFFFWGLGGRGMGEYSVLVVIFACFTMHKRQQQVMQILFLCSCCCWCSSLCVSLFWIISLFPNSFGQVQAACWSKKMQLCFSSSHWLIFRENQIPILGWNRKEVLLGQCGRWSLHNRGCLQQVLAWLSCSNIQEASCKLSVCLSVCLCLVVNQTFVAPSCLPWNLRVKFVKFRMSHKWFIPEYCGDLFIYLFLGGLFLLLQIALWTGLVMGGGAGLTVPGRYGVATEKTVSAFFSWPNLDEKPFCSFSQQFEENHFVCFLSNLEENPFAIFKSLQCWSVAAECILVSSYYGWECFPPFVNRCFPCQKQP